MKYAHFLFYAVLAKHLVFCPVLWYNFSCNDCTNIRRDTNDRDHRALNFAQAQLLASLMLLITNALPNVAGVGPMEFAFLLLFAALLIWKKKYMTILVGALAGILYMIVDFGIFHLVCHSRSISDGHSLFWVLLWMSVSYGFTNFAWIWLWLSKDERLFEWSFLILLWWFACPQLSKTFTPAGTANIVIQRTTGEYHGYMAAILLFGYLALIIYDLWQKDRTARVNIPWLLAGGILVQFGWEAGLLIGGIRSAGFATLADKLRPLIVNSLLETNLGMPYIYLIFLAYTRRFTGQMKRRRTPITLTGRIRENNAEKVRTGE